MKREKVIPLIVIGVLTIVIGVIQYNKYWKNEDKTAFNSENTQMRAEYIKINDAITLINDAGESTYYVVCGTKKALIIDTGNGYDDVIEVAREITDLPIEVVNTHGHCDHVYGNIYCDEAWIHPKDIDLCRMEFQIPLFYSLGTDQTCCDLKALEEGQTFDLGELELEVVEIPGHTPGSIGILDRAHRILFSGDALNQYIWLQLAECLPLSEARANMGVLMDTYGDAFDFHLSGHTTSLIPKEDIFELMDGCDEILAGNNKEDKDYEWFGGIGKYHIYGTSEGKQICYDPDNL